MRKITIILTLLYVCINTLQAQTAMTIEQLDFVYHKTGQEKKTIYYTSNPMPPIHRNSYPLMY